MVGAALASSRLAIATPSAWLLDLARESGIIGERKDEVLAALAQAGFLVERVLESDDWIAILGKGHETGQQLAQRTIPFDDVVVVRREWLALAGERDA